MCEENKKECNKCLKIKDLEEFRVVVSKNRKPYQRKTCKECDNIKKKETRNKNKLKICETQSIYSDEGIQMTLIKPCSKCNEEKALTEYSCIYKEKKNLRSKCKECEKQFRTENKDKITAQKKEYMARPEVKENRKNYIQEYQKRPEYKENYNRNMCNYRKNNRNARIASCLRQRTLSAITKGWKSASTMELLGCTIEEFTKHLESQFTEGMTWDNFGRGEGRWSMDHIKCCASFKLEDPVQQRECFNWKNIQPMWWEENNDKNDWMELDGEMIRARTLKKKNPTD